LLRQAAACLCVDLSARPNDPANISQSYLDGPTRTGGYGPVIHPSGDVKADMDLIRAFYADKGGVKPRNKTTPRLRDEEHQTAR
jgi:hypothetical protein